MYFIGVTTAGSMSMRAFPKWAEVLGLEDGDLVGMDFAPRSDPGALRDAVDWIKAQPLARGALVTTHKIDLLNAAGDRFDSIEPLAAELGEIGSIYKRGGRLCGRATDAETGGIALRRLLPSGHWRREPGAEVLLLGAGGAASAMVWHLLKGEAPDGRPAKITAVDVDPERVRQLAAKAARWGGGRRVEGHSVSDVGETDQLIASLPPASLVINATGVGKDLPGSPVGKEAVFPERGLVWEYNYRGDLQFLDIARRQRRERDLLVVEDGWRYFILGWAAVIADVFQLELDLTGELIDEMDAAAAKLR